jgi:2-methylcitrate dehydratase PrpD
VARAPELTAVAGARRLAEFAALLEFDDLPPVVVASACLRTLDIIGIALAASVGETAPSIFGALEGWGAGGDCTVIGGKRTAAAPLAILANGALAHSLDFDDTHAASITHASAVVVPVALAAGEATGADGRALITAMVAGYESITRLGMAASGAFHARGWHATGVCGPFAAALVAGRIERLDADRLTAALGIAGSFASGVLEYLADGSWVKRVHAGWAGHAGAIATALARGGFTGPASVLDGRFGFYRTFVDAEPDLSSFATLGRDWETPAIGFKPYPCCHYNHAYLDCALQLRREHALDADDVEAVECRVPAGQVPIVCEPRPAKLRPRSPYDAQFSLPYSVASALLDGHVGLDTYTAERLEEPRRLALAARVDHVVDPDSAFPRGFPGWVRVRLRDGRILEARTPDGQGSLARPLPPQAIVAKFRDNAGRALPAGRVGEIERVVLGLDAVADVHALTSLLRG